MFLSSLFRAVKNLLTLRKVYTVYSNKLDLICIFGRRKKVKSRKFPLIIIILGGNKNKNLSKIGKPNHFQRY